MSRESDAIFFQEAWQPLLDTVIEGVVVVDDQGLVRYINRHAADHLGISLSEANGKHFRDIFCPSLPMQQCWVNIALKENQDLRYHFFEMENVDGSTRRLVANLTGLKNSEGKLAGAMISLRIEDESKRLRAEREKQDAILSSLAEGLFTVDNEWRITSLNRAAQRITGWREQEVLGKYCKDVIGTKHCVDNCPLAETLKRSKPIIDFEMELRNKNGKELPVNVNTAILYSNGGEVIGGVVSFRDCSIQERLENDRKASSSFYGLVGKNRRMLDVYQMIQETADSKATVLILGESGTGKELVANAIRKLSNRASKPYIRVNCAAIPDTLLESELFGHVKGAFTDAHSNRMGRFELADGGTVFLDEVGDLTAPAQLRLLRVLEEGEFQRLGSSETVKVDVRVIAATNRDLWKMVQEGTFRDDLYYRLNVIPISLPPLRERLDDLAYLIEHFMEKYRHITDKPITEISDKAYDLLDVYQYPGNVRELENIIEHAFVRTQGNIITEHKLPLYLRQTSTLNELEVPEEDSAQTLESRRIREMLTQCHWNRAKAAQKLGISRTTLWRRMKELDLLEAGN